VSDRLPSELRAVEREIDTYHLADPLMREHFATAAWHFLAFCEERAIAQLIHVEQTATPHEEAIFPDVLLVHAKWPLNWISATCEPGGNIPRKYDEAMYEAAWIKPLVEEYL